jgi:hypothetical protein
MASRLAAERNANRVIDELEHIAFGEQAATGGRNPPLPADTVWLIARRAGETGPGENPDAQSPGMRPAARIGSSARQNCCSGRQRHH